MIRLKKYKKSLSQFIKETSKNMNDMEILFLKTAIIPNRSLQQWKTLLEKMEKEK